MARDPAPDADGPDGPWARGVANALANPRAFYRGLFGLAVALVVVPFALPLYWLAVLAVTPPSATYQVGLVPGAVTPVNLLVVIARYDFHAYLFNSLVIAAASTVVVLVVGSLAGYAFGRLSFPGRTTLLVVTLTVAYFPPVSFLVPLFSLFVGDVGILGVRPPPIYRERKASASGLDPEGEADQ